MNPTCLALCLALCSTAFAAPRLLEQDDAPRLEGSAREKLLAQLTLLEEDRPTLTIGRNLLIGAGAAAVAGGLVCLGALALFNSANNTADAFESTLVALGGLVVGVVGVVVLVAAAVLLLTGGVSLLVKLKQRSNRDEELNEVRQRLDELDRAEAAPLVRVTPLERSPLPGFVVATF